jgi:hypothetical protein
MLFAWYNRDGPPYFLGICLELRHTRSAPGLSLIPTLTFALFPITSCRQL